MIHLSEIKFWTFKHFLHHLSQFLVKKNQTFVLVYIHIAGFVKNKYRTKIIQLNTFKSVHIEANENISYD
jgi:hypothetical protein